MTQIKKIIYAASCFAFCVVVSFTSKAEHEIKDFSLTNVDGENIALSNYPNARGFIIIFTCNHCPFAKLYPQRLNALNAKYSSQNVPLLTISSTDTVQYSEDTFGKMKEKAQKENYNFPYLFDGDQQVAKNFKAQKTPHAYLIWKVKGKWRIKYNGAIDDNGMEPEKVENDYISAAVDALLSDKEVVVKESKSIGCQINFRK